MRKIISEKDFCHGNFIREGTPKIWQGSKRSYKRRTVILRCAYCHQEFSVDLQNALRTQPQCCSRQCAGKLKESYPGGVEQHPLYSRWLCMKQRCLNPDSNNYKNYGGRGITIYSPWITDFFLYASYLESLPGAPKEYPTLLSVDRINGNAGYYPGNLRWASGSLQVVNQRKQEVRGKTSKYRGVCFSTIHQRWVATITWKHHTLFSRTFTSEVEAVIARNNFIVENKLPHAVQEVS